MPNIYIILTKFITGGKREVPSRQAHVGQLLADPTVRICGPEDIYLPDT